MGNQLLNDLSKLNRLESLYDKAILECKPYRITSIRKIHNQFLDDFQQTYGTIIALDSSNYSVLLEGIPQIEHIIKQKERSAKSKEYEDAANFRDMEKKLIRLHLQAKYGFDSSIKFFEVENHIYKLF